MSTTTFSPTALSYAQSILELATAQGQAVDIGHELADIRQIIDTDETFRLFLADPSISETTRAGVLERVFKGRISQLTYGFLQVVNLKGRLGITTEIAGAYEQLLDDQLGKVDVDLTVAQALSDWELADVQQRISQALGKDAVVHQYVDDAIIGGLVLRVRDKLIDGSVRTQLQQMKEKILAARPK